MLAVSDDAENPRPSVTEAAASAVSSALKPTSNQRGLYAPVRSNDGMPDPTSLARARHVCMLWSALVVLVMVWILVWQLQLLYSRDQQTNERAAGGQIVTTTTTTPQIGSNHTNSTGKEDRDSVQSGEDDADSLDTPSHSNNPDAGAPSSSNSDNNYSDNDDDDSGSRSSSTSSSGSSGSGGISITGGAPVPENGDTGIGPLFPVCLDLDWRTHWDYAHEAGSPTVIGRTEGLCCPVRWSYDPATRQCLSEQTECGAGCHVCDHTPGGNCLCCGAQDQCSSVMRLDGSQLWDPMCLVHVSGGGGAGLTRSYMQMYEVVGRRQAMPVRLATWQH